MLLLVFILQNGTETADLVDLSKVYHEDTSLSGTKGERNSPFDFIQLLSMHRHELWDVLNH